MEELKTAKKYRDLSRKIKHEERENPSKKITVDVQKTVQRSSETMAETFHTIHEDDTKHRLKVHDQGPRCFTRT